MRPCSIDIKTSWIASACACVHTNLLESSCRSHLSKNFTVFSSLWRYGGNESAFVRPTFLSSRFISSAANIYWNERHGDDRESRSGEAAFENR